jgi:hypothetical protein
MDQGIYKCSVVFLYQNEWLKKNKLHQVTELSVDEDYLTWAIFSPNEGRLGPEGRCVSPNGKVAADHSFFFFF